MYLAVVGIEGYVVTPLVMGRSLDLNGTTVLLACLFWGYLWGLVGLVLAMPITVSLKVVLPDGARAQSLGRADVGRLAVARTSERCPGETCRRACFQGSRVREHGHHDVERFRRSSGHAAKQP